MGLLGELVQGIKYGPSQPLGDMAGEGLNLATGWHIANLTLWNVLQAFSITAFSLLCQG